MLKEDSEHSQQACYLCNSASITMSKNRRAIKFKRIHKYFKCIDCNSFSLFPKLDAEEINDLYSTKYIENVNPGFDNDEKNTEDRFLKLKEALDQIDDKGAKRFLDYGCGSTAEAVTLASKLNYESFGVEVEMGTREQAMMESGCKIYSPEEIMATGDQFDIIFLGDVLEHLNDPLATLKQLSHLLRPQGLLIIQGPLEAALTVSNLLLSVKANMLTKSPSVFPPYHVSLATRDSIAKALKISEFTIQRISITEPLWPAPKFGSKASLASPGSLIFSFVKIIDLAISRVSKIYGTRFFIVAKHVNYLGED